MEPSETKPEKQKTMFQKSGSSDGNATGETEVTSEGSSVGKASTLRFYCPPGIRQNTWNMGVFGFSFRGDRSEKCYMPMFQGRKVREHFRFCGDLYFLQLTVNSVAVISGA